MWRVLGATAVVAICATAPAQAQDEAAAKNMRVAIDSVYRAIDKKKPDDSMWSHTCQNIGDTCTYANYGYIIQARENKIEIWPNNTTDPDAVIEACSTAFSKFAKLNAKRAENFVYAAFAEAQMQPSQTLDYYGVGGINFYVTQNHSADPTLKCWMVDRRKR